MSTSGARTWSWCSGRCLYRYLRRRDAIASGEAEKRSRWT